MQKGILTGIPRVLLLPKPFNRTVICRKHTTPDTEVTTKNRRSCLDGCDCAYPSLSVGAVPKSLHTVPDCTTNSLTKYQYVDMQWNVKHESELWKTYTHTESTTEVAQGDPGARIPRVIHSKVFKVLTKRYREGLRGRRSLIRRAVKPVVRRSVTRKCAVFGTTKKAERNTGNEVRESRR